MIGALAVYSADVAYPAGQRHICCGRYPATWDSEKRVTEAAGPLASDHPDRHNAAGLHSLARLRAPTRRRATLPP